jgi:hypothetical protein
MTNPLIHALVFLAAVIIPGGLLVYFAWRLRKKSVTPPTPDEALEAFRHMFPEGSLRAKTRLERLKLIRRRKTRPRKKSQ